MIVVSPSQPRKQKVTQSLQAEAAASPEKTEVTSLPAPPSESAKPTKTKKKRQRPGRHPRLIPVEEALSILTEFWPALIADGQCRQLKIGINKDMKAEIDQRELALSKKKLGSVLMTITKSEAYRRASIAGTIRYDSAGQPAGEVALEDAYNREN